MELLPTWARPHLGVVKVNFDTSITASSLVGFGLIGWDVCGEVIVAGNLASFAFLPPVLAKSM